MACGVMRDRRRGMAASFGARRSASAASGSMTCATGGATHTSLGIAAIDGELREPRRAERRADLAALQIDQRAPRSAAAIDPAPIARARAAADHRQLGDVGAGLAQRIEPVGEREGDAFEHGLRQAAGVGVVVEAEEGAADLRHRCAACARPTDRAGTARARWPDRPLRRARTARRRRLAPVSRATQSMQEAARQVDRHLVPQVGQAVAEGVDGARRVGPESVVGDEDHARRAERQQRIAVAHHADADGARGIVAAAAGHGHRAHAPERGDLGAERAGDSRCLRPAPASGRGREPAGGEQLVAPVPRARRRATACRLRPTCRTPCRRSSAAGHSPWAAAPSRSLRTPPARDRAPRAAWAR